MDERIFDVIVLGGGPAGLSAALYASRSGLSVAVLDKSLIGGQPMYYFNIENYPGYSGESAGLSEKFENQALKFGACTFPIQEVKRVILKGKFKQVETSEFTFKAKAIIICTGAHPKFLNIPGEYDNIGKGVSFCAVCDGAFYSDKTVAVVGGGNSAVEEACYLTRFASHVYIIHRRNKLRADKVVQDRAFRNSKISFLWNSEVTEVINENNKVSRILVKNRGTVSSLNVDGIFPYIGYAPNTDFITDTNILNENGFIITNEKMETELDGVFAAGDVRVTPLRQVITSVSDGAIAATYAGKYIDSKKGE